MIKNVAALEITDGKAKFAVGYALNKKPYLLFYKELPLVGKLSQGEIVDPKGLSKLLSSFGQIEDESMRLKLDTDDVSLILPPLGFEVYQNNKTTNVVSPDDTVDDLDINNVMMLVKKELVPNGNSIVDIVPDCFILANGKAYANPPIHEKSETLTIHAKVHTLPQRLVESYQSATQAAGLRVRRMSVAPYCEVELIASEGERYPKNYFLVDMGESLSTVSFVGERMLFGSFVIPQGGKDLTKAIAEKLGLSLEEAEALKDKYGYDTRKRGYEIPMNALGKNYPPSVNKEALSKVIEGFVKDYLILIENGIEGLIRKQKGDPNNPGFLSIPLLYTGGASRLYGLPELMKRAFPNRPLIPYVPSVLGARKPELTSLLGLILTGSEYRGTLEDHYHGVSALTRSKEAR